MQVLTPLFVVPTTPAVEGNELPNAPRLTFNIGAQYTFFIDEGDWELTFRGDYYRQSKSFARVYNTEYDRLKAWDNANLAITLERPASQIAFQFYVKNLFKTEFAGAFFVAPYFAGQSRCAHICSGGFILEPAYRGNGIGNWMLCHCY